MRSKKTKQSTYTPRPTVNPEVLTRLAVISRVMSGETTVTAAAQELGLSRNHFQSLYHRSLGAMMEELEPKVGGRPRKNEETAALQEERARLEAQVRSLTTQLDASRRATLGLAEIVREQHAIGRRRAPRTKGAKAKEATSDASDDDGRRALLCEARRMIIAGVPEALAAESVSTAASTLRRWRMRERRGEPLARRRGPRHAVEASPTTVKAAEARVRDVHGHIGAAALGKAIGLPRRTAAAVKACVLTRMERERKEAARHVEMTSPGAVRGFDQMYVRTFGGWIFALINADAAIPYRTSAQASKRYTGSSVRRALELDFEANGAPLVARLDRAAVHRTDDVTDLLEAHGVLALHGPAGCPRYYGQLERQNREHRAWLNGLELRDELQLAEALDEMLRGLNTLVPRRSLGWCTPAQRWEQRPPLTIDRDAFREEVHERAAEIALGLSERERALGYGQRFAIERTLAVHGLLRINNEGRC